MAKSARIAVSFQATPLTLVSEKEAHLAERGWVFAGRDADRIALFDKEVSTVLTEEALDREVSEVMGEHFAGAHLLDDGADVVRKGDPEWDKIVRAEGSAQISLPRP